MVTADQLKTAINAAVSDMKELFKTVVTELQNEFEKKLNDSMNVVLTKLDDTSKTLVKALELSQENEKKIVELNDRYLTLESSQKDLSDKFNVLHEKFEEQEKERIKLEERLESRTNRSLRKTLVFKGIQGNEETWEETSEKLAGVLVQTVGLPIARARNMIERAHRGRRSEFNPNAPRPIYAAIFNWKDSEYIKEQFRQQNVKNQSFPYAVDQMYGPLTSRRRHHAMKIRKELKGDGSICAGYVSYPAKLMVKYNHTEKSYSEHADFSKMEVVFGNDIVIHVNDDAEGVD